MRVIGYHPASKDCLYILRDDGTVWYKMGGNIAVNNGPYDEFMEKVRTGKVRFVPRD